jgi:hypothetical protein
MKEKIDKLSSSKIKTFSAECYRGSGEKNKLQTGKE